MTSQPRLDDRLIELRRTFDDSFAAPLSAAPPPADELLGLRIGADRFAVKVREISGLAVDRKIVPVPSRAPALLGIAGVRGCVVPVFRLAALLGYPENHEHTRWLALCGQAEPIGLSFQELEGTFRVTRLELFRTSSEQTPRRFVADVVRVGGVVRSVIDIPSLLKAIEARAGSAAPAKES